MPGLSRFASSSAAIPSYNRVRSVTTHIKERDRMEKTPNKLKVSQETLRNLSTSEAGRDLRGTQHTYVVSNCPFPCTPVAGVN